MGCGEPMGSGNPTCCSDSMGCGDPSGGGNTVAGDNTMGNVNLVAVSLAPAIPHAQHPMRCSEPMGSSGPNSPFRRTAPEAGFGAGHLRSVRPGRPSVHDCSPVGLPNVSDNLILSTRVL